MLFFKALVKKTLKLKYLALRYQLFFWHNVQVTDLALSSETHSLDYNAKSWAVSEISAVHKHMVYDTQTLFSFSEYYDNKALFLKIKEMTIDFEPFPTKIRSFAVIKKEYERVKMLFKLEKIVENNLTKKKDMNFFFNKHLLRTNLRRKGRKKTLRWLKWRRRKLRRSYKKARLKKNVKNAN